MSILVTGGAGYIGSHICLELLRKNYSVIVVDNLSNSTQAPLYEIIKITNNRNLRSYLIDLCDIKNLEKVFRLEITTVIHCAGLKAVGESSEIPLDYYQNNIAGTLNLLTLMEKYNVRNIIFSSSATVYGKPKYLPIDEKHTLAPESPYGRTKYFIEQILIDLYNSTNQSNNKQTKNPKQAKNPEQTKNPEWNIIILRYFNPVGADESGKIGEEPQGIPNNLMPYICKVLSGDLSELKVFGADYDTPDGTGVRDYIHVTDLAKGHLAALDKIDDYQKHHRQESYLGIYNLGTGRGYSVFEMIEAMEKASKRKIKHQMADRRPGDVAELYADASLANQELDWKCEFGLDEIVKSAWRWVEHKKNVLWVS